MKSNGKLAQNPFNSIRSMMNVSTIDQFNPILKRGCVCSNSGLTG